MTIKASYPPAGTPAVGTGFFDRIWFNWFRDFYLEFTNTYTATNTQVTTNTTNIATNTAAIAAITSSKLIKTVTTSTGAVATGTTTIPFDDTIPQITEGTEFMTLAITPTNALNMLRIEVYMALIGNNVVGVSTDTVALFQDSTANALASVGQLQSLADEVGCLCLTHIMVAGTTSSTTFRVRAGQNAAGTTTFNGRSAGRIYGGAASSRIVITEYIP